MIKCCVFDLDGTLLNTLPTIALHANNTLKAYGLPTYRTDEFRKFVGDGAKILIERVLRGVSADMRIYDEFYRDYLRDYDEDPHVETTEYDGISAMLETLAEGGCRLAVLSNKQESGIRPLMDRFFSVSFTHLIGAGEDRSLLKPCPANLLRLFDEWQISPEECLYLGDGIPDMQVARRAGILTPLAALWGFTSKEDLLREGGYPVKNPQEVLEFFRMSDGQRQRLTVGDMA